MSDSTHGSASQTANTTGFTEPKAEQCATSEALRFIRQITELSPVVLDIFDLSTERHTYRSSNTMSLFGYTSDEIAQMKDIFSAMVHPEDLPRLTDNIAQLKQLQDGETLEFECRVHRRDGEWRWAASRSMVFGRDEDGRPRQIISATLDITERKRAEDALKQSEERFRALIENSSDIISVLRSDGTMLYKSPSVTAILGYHPGELIGKNALGFIHADDVPGVAEDFRRIFEQPHSAVYALSGRFRHKNGSWRDLESVGKTWLDESGERVGIFNSRDVTERRRTEEGLAQVAEGAKRDQELKSTFLDALAHEIKTPLAAAKMAVTTLLAHDGKMAAEQRRELLGVIDRTADRLNAWSSETIHAVSIEAGTLSFTKKRRNIAQMVRRIAAELSQEFENTPLDAQLDVTWCEVEVDGEMIEAVLRILVENARKYSPAGSPVVISCRREGQNTIVGVRDFGPGIKPDEQNRIFEKYYRGRSSAQTQGMGLGLAIAQKIVRAHGGDIWVTSEPGHGATFQFSLPSFQ